jgi:probable F420-dependent oxidoreductase
MKLGVATVITDESIRPDVLAKALEERGFDSLVVAEHSHIPTSRVTPFPAGGELPREYYRSYDPFVALTAAALATSKLLIGPGVLLLPQRDAIETAKAVSSLDQLSAGRLLLGLGLGWNLEESADHGVEATMRGKLFDEKLAAMKELWVNEEAEFHGYYVDVDATYCWPKPVQKPHPKIYIGGFTAATVSRARRHHAGWMPMAVPVADMVPAQPGPSRRCIRHSSQCRRPRKRRTRCLGRLPTPWGRTGVHPPFHQTRIGNAPTARQHCGTHRNIQLSRAGRPAPGRTASICRMHNCGNTLKKEDTL